MGYVANNTATTDAAPSVSAYVRAIACPEYTSAPSPREACTTRRGGLGGRVTAKVSARTTDASPNRPTRKVKGSAPARSATLAKNANAAERDRGGKNEEPGPIHRAPRRAPGDPATIGEVKEDAMVTDLSSEDLSGHVFSGQDLSGRELAGKHFRNARFRGTDLSCADLSDADLEGADLSDADLSGAKLAGANLAWAVLVGANLSGADLAGAVFLGADLTGATIDDEAAAAADMTGVRR